MCYGALDDAWHDAAPPHAVDCVPGVLASVDDGRAACTIGNLYLPTVPDSDGVAVLIGEDLRGDAPDYRQCGVVGVRFVFCDQVGAVIPETLNGGLGKGAPC